MSSRVMKSCLCVNPYACIGFMIRRGGGGGGGVLFNPSAVNQPPTKTEYPATAPKHIPF